jgi:hypothetical protein
MNISEQLPFTFMIEKDGIEYRAWRPELSGCYTDDTLFGIGEFERCCLVVFRFNLISR